jgi:TonB family protein
MCGLRLTSVLAFAVIAASPIARGQAARKPSQTLPVMPNQQVQFCEAFKEDERQHQKYDADLKAAGDNPVRRALVEKNPPDFDRLLEAQQLAVMGNGVFRDWVGYLELSVDHNIATVKIRFTCVRWSPTIVTAIKGSGGRIRQDNLYIGNEFNPGRGSGGVPVDSEAGQALARFETNEAVSVTGQLFCSPQPRYREEAAGVPRQRHTGCDNDSTSIHPIGLFWAKIATLRSFKTGFVARLGDDPPAGNSDRVNVDIKSNSAITFYRTDSLETLKEKSRALVGQKPGPDSTRLMEYFNQPTCIACDRPKTFSVVAPQAYELGPSGRVALIKRPCVMNGQQHPNCTDSFPVYVAGDIPSWAETEGADGPFVPGKAGGCYFVGKREEETLKQRTREINDMLRPLAKTLEPNPAANNSAKPCEAFNAAIRKERETIADQRNSRDEMFRAVATTITADEFEARLQEAVKIKALKLGADPVEYGPMIKIVSTIVRLCSSMSEEDFTGSMDRFGMPHLGSYQNGKYKDCIPATRWVPDGREPPGLVIRHDLRNNWDKSQQRWNGTKLHIDVFLKPISIDPNSTTEANEARYIALSADIKNPGRAVEPIVSLGSPQPVESTQPKSRLTVTPGGLPKPEPIKKINPAYPPLAKAARIQGTVMFIAVIDEDGRVEHLTLTKGSPMLAKAAEDAARQWVYAPMRVNGKPVPMQIALEVEFTP